MTMPIKITLQKYNFDIAPTLTEQSIEDFITYVKNYNQNTTRSREVLTGSSSVSYSRTPQLPPELTLKFDGDKIKSSHNILYSDLINGTLDLGKVIINLVTEVYSFKELFLCQSMVQNKIVVLLSRD